MQEMSKSRATRKMQRDQTDQAFKAVQILQREPQWLTDSMGLQAVVQQEVIRFQAGMD